MTESFSSPRTAAFFDFDATLVKHDSLPQFLALVVGWPKTIATFLLAIVAPDKSQPDWKGAIKASWLRLTLAGLPEAQVRTVAEQLTPNWIPEIHQRLLELHAQGATIIVATGALDLYVRALLRSLPVDVVMATEMEVVDGRLTGRMQGGNCVRLEKARRVAAYLSDNAPFTKTYGFGNAPSDLPMLKLVDEARVV